MSRRSEIESRPKTKDFSSLKLLARYVMPYKWLCIGALAALLLTSGAVLGLGKGLQFLVDEGLGKGDPHLLNRAFGIMAGVVILLAVTTFFRYLFITWLGEKVVADIRRDVFAHMIHLDVGFYETTRTGEILSRMTTDTTVLQAVVGSTVSVALRNCLLLVGASAMLVFTSPKLALYVALIVPVVVIPIITLGRKVRTLSRITQDRMADVSARIEECVSGIRAVQALSLEQEQQRHFNGDIHALLAAAKSRIHSRAWLTAIVITLVFGAITTVLWIGGRDVLSGELSPGALSAFIFYSVVAAGAVGAISEVVGDLQRAAGATERLRELLLTPSALPLPASPQCLPEETEGRITFEKVHFAYPSRPDKEALRSISLTIEPGQTVAIVGPSGAGKTTLFQLLMRFYDPASGIIRVDNMPIHQLLPQNLRHHIGFVPQDPVIFSGNAWENIRAGFLDASDEDVMEAAAKARAREFLETLPQGFATHLGEKGIRLSGGQRQRLAIARALVRNPRILLLDEATNALDAENEHLVQQAIETSIHGRTTLIIAHRLSTILNADNIIVMEDGAIQATGTHAQLLETSPLYRKLAKLQFHLAAETI